MSKSNHVEQLTVTVTLGNGEQHTLTVNRPGNQGANPAFLAQQIDAGMTELTERLDRLTDLYGKQLRGAALCSRPPGLIHEEPCNSCGHPKAEHAAAWSVAR